MRDLTADAEQRHREAIERRDRIVVAWEAEGRPLTTRGSQGQLVEHPYIRMMRDHDLLVARLAAVLQPRRIGRPPTAVITPSIGRSPAVRLRVVPTKGPKSAS